MAERNDAVTFKGNPVTLTGEIGNLAEGKPVPDLPLTGQDMSDKKISDYRGKVVVLSTVPSIDTPVCDNQTRQFNEKAAGMDNVVVVTVSMDLPFAFKRWCAAAGLEGVECLSDFKTHEFAKATGLQIKELGLLARSVSVVDGEGKVTYHQLVDEIASEPNYDQALEAAKAAR